MPVHYKIFDPSTLLASQDFSPSLHSTKSSAGSFLSILFNWKHWLVLSYSWKSFFKNFCVFLVIISLWANPLKGLHFLSPLLCHLSHHCAVWLLLCPLRYSGKPHRWFQYWWIHWALFSSCLLWPLLHNLSLLDFLCFYFLCKPPPLNSPLSSATLLNFMSS